jgi:shikimate dehydrogenase
MNITGKTKLVGLFGYPIGHSVSPQMHNAAFAHLGLDWCYLPFAVAPKDLEQALRALPALGIVGANVTIPHKESALRAVDEVTPVADLVGAVNTVHCQGGKLIGYNTDVAGFTRSLTEAGENLRGRTAVVLGAGGAARAAVVGLAKMGTARIWVAALPVEMERAASAAGLARRAARGAVGAAIEWRRPALRSAVEAAEVLVNATPIGMYPHHTRPAPVPQAWLRKDMLVFDMVYNPVETRLLTGARKRGCRTVGGMRMLVLQGAESFTIWSGQAAPVEVMQEAVAGALAR